MHRYIARAIACFILSVALSLLVATVASGGKKRVEIRTDAQTADIVAAVEALKRKDITVKVVEDQWVSSPVSGVVMGSLSMALLLWVSTSMVKFIEGKIIERYPAK